ncbi:hypothetical protein ACYF6T_39115 [Streptomyces sp. 7R007]
MTDKPTVPERGRSQPPPVDVRLMGDDAPVRRMVAALLQAAASLRDLLDFTVKD